MPNAYDRVATREYIDSHYARGDALYVAVGLLDGKPVASNAPAGRGVAMDAAWQLHTPECPAVIVPLSLERAIRLSGNAP